MTEPILSRDYWRGRLQAATKIGQLHHAIFRTPLDRWRAIEAKHRIILARTIGINDSVLDCGCGWGRLLELMPPYPNWKGAYLGVDLSPDFIQLAKTETPNRDHCNSFLVADLRQLSQVIYLPPFGQKWRWAVLISVRPMVKRNLGDDVWAQMETEIRKCADKLLYLEYDPDCEGFIE